VARGCRVRVQCHVGEPAKRQLEWRHAGDNGVNGLATGAVSCADVKRARRGNPRVAEAAERLSPPRGATWPLRSRTLADRSRTSINTSSPVHTARTATLPSAASPGLPGDRKVALPHAPVAPVPMTLSSLPR
jgi:hypothetical protein